MATLIAKFVAIFRVVALIVGTLGTFFIVLWDQTKPQIEKITVKLLDIASTAFPNVGVDVNDPFASIDGHVDLALINTVVPLSEGMTLLVAGFTLWLLMITVKWLRTLLPVI